MKNEILIKILTGLDSIEKCKGQGSAQLKQNILKDLILNYGVDTEKVLKVAFDREVVTHYGKVEESTVYMTRTLSDFDFDDVVDTITKVKALDSILRGIVNTYISTMKHEYDATLAETLGKVLTKSLNIGISVTTINKVFGYKFIEDLEVMKGESDTKYIVQWYEQKRKVYAEIKYDGIRCFSIVDGVTKKLKKAFTYNLSLLDLSKMTYLVEELEGLAQHITEYGDKDFFFDFEITGKNRQGVSGEVGKLINGTAVVGCDENWMANIFDLVPCSIFDGVRTKDYEVRTDVLRYGFREYIASSLNTPAKEVRNLTVAKRWIVDSMEGLNKLFLLVLEQGEEGLMVKVANGEYELDRSTLWVKMKAVNDADLEIIGWYEGEKGTKREQYIGGFICQTCDGLLEVNVGGGFSDKLLKEINVNGPDSYVGKIVAVLYNMVIDKKDGGKQSLFLPRLSKRKDVFRIDKTVGNKLSELKRA